MRYWGAVVSWPFCVTVESVTATRVILALALLFSACGTATESNESAVGEPATATGKLVGQYQTVSGETVDLASLQGKDLVVWFWAPW